MLQQIAAELGTSRSTVWLALHGARVAVGAGGGARSSDGPPRVLADELYADPQIVGVLQAHQAQLFEPKAWAGPAAEVLRPAAAGRRAASGAVRRRRPGDEGDLDAER
jgi:hypothetical protein